MVIVMRKDDETLSQISECCICLQTYTAFICIPVTMPCGHTFCKRCVTLLADSLFKCCICRAEFSKLERKHMKRNALLCQVLEKVDTVLTTKPPKDTEEAFMLNPVVLQEDDPELIELARCIDCKKPFTNGRRIPITIRCGHTMCELCVIRRNGSECVNCGLVYRVTYKDLNKCICLINLFEQMNLLAKDSPYVIYVFTRIINFFWNILLTIRTKTVSFFHFLRNLTMDNLLYVLYFLFIITISLLVLLVLFDLRKAQMAVRRSSPTYRRFMTREEFDEDEFPRRL